MTQAVNVVIDTVIQRNAFFAHTKYMLSAMITDDRKHIHELRFRRIVKVRSVNTSGKVKQFQVPAINFNAADCVYIDLIQWDKIKVTKPSILSNLSYCDSKMCIEKRDREDTFSFA